jgi:hypothetical protein
LRYRYHETMGARLMGIKFCKTFPRTIESESNDCAVRALSIACDIPYHEAHSRFSKVGRKPNKGVSVDMLSRVLGDRPIGSDWLSYTLSRFCALKPKGRFLVLKRNHAFAVVNGVVHDWGKLGGNTKVYSWWEIKS